MLSADFNLEGTKIVSAGMDHRLGEQRDNALQCLLLKLICFENFSLKIWKFDSEALEEAVKLSYTHDTLKTKTVFPTGNSSHHDLLFQLCLFLRTVSLP